MKMIEVNGMKMKITFHCDFQELRMTSFDTRLKINLSNTYPDF